MRSMRARTIMSAAALAIAAWIALSTFYKTDIAQRDFLPWPVERLRQDGSTVAPKTRSEPMQTQFRQLSAEAGGQALAEEETPLCTFSVIKKYISSNNFYPGQGSWSWSAQGTLPHFRPDICWFKYDYKSLPTDYVPTCFKKNQIKRFLFVGDSQGSNYFEMFLYLANSKGFSCDTRVFRNTGRPRPPSVIACTMKSANPNHPDSLVQVEYLPLFKYHKIPDNKGHSAPSRQDYLFRTYLRDNVPDLMMLFGNHHDFRDYNLAENKEDIDTLIDMLKETVLPTVPLIWVTTTDEYESKRPQNKKNIRYDDGKYNASQKTRLVNELLFNATKQLVAQEHGRLLPFLDMQRISQGVMKKLSKDGVHFQELWYTVIFSYLLQTICESDLGKLFGHKNFR